MAIAVFVHLWPGWPQESHDEREVSPVMNWPYLAAAAVLAINVLILVAFSWEIHCYWWLVRWRGDSSLLQDYWDVCESFPIQPCFMLLAARF